MGILGDIKSRVFLEYKADVSDAERNIKRLAGEQKKAAKEAVEGLKDQIKWHETMAAKIAGGMAIAGGAIAIGISAWRSYSEQTRLTAATASVNIDKLRDASHGLVTDLELMKVAAAGANGKWKLTSDELANVLGAARALELQGLGPLAESAMKIGEAVKKGEVDPLKELGIVYDEQLAKYDKRAAAMKALAQLAEESANTAETEAEAMQRRGTAAENYYDRAKGAIGQFAQETVAGFVIIADSIGDMGSALKEWGTRDLTFAEIQTMARMNAIFAAVEKNAADIRQKIAVQAAADAEVARVAAEEAGWVDYKSAARLRIQNEEIEAKKADWQARRDKAAARRRAAAAAGYTPPGLVEVVGQSDIKISKAQEIDNLTDAIARARETLDFGALGTEASDALVAGSGKTPSLVERLFGPLDEIDTYRGALDSLKDSMVAGYEAMVTGSESAGAAIKKVLAGAIMAKGKSMFVDGLEAAAAAIKDLATGNFAGAGAHGLAAAKYFAGAATAGIIANQLGAGGSAGAGGGASAGGARSPSSFSGVGGGGNSGPRTNVYLLSDMWGTESSRQQANRFRNSEGMARMLAPRTDGAEYS